MKKINIFIQTLFFIALLATEQQAQAQVTLALNNNTSNGQQICEGSSVVLSASTANPVVCPNCNYTWNTGSSIVNTTTNNLQIIVGGNAAYSVTVTDNNGNSASDNLTIIPLSPPQTNITGASSTCSSGVTLIATGNIDDIQWQFNGSNISGTSFILANQTGIYSVVVTDANGCTGSDVHEVSINVPPSLTMEAPSLVCGGSTINISTTTTPLSGNYSYQWNNGSTEPTLSLDAVNSSENLSFSVTVTDTETTCTAQQNTIIQVAPIPELLLLQAVLNRDANSGICPENFEFNDNVIELDTFFVNQNDVENGTWQIQDGPIAGIFLDTINDVLIAFPNAPIGNYVLTYHGIAPNNCSIDYEIPFQVLTCNCPSIIPSIADDWCIGTPDILQLDYFIPSGGGSITLDNLTLGVPGGEIITLSPNSTTTETTASVSPEVPGVYVLNYTFTIQNAQQGCLDIQGSKSFIVHALPNVEVIGADTVCADTPASFSASAGFGNSYTWYVGPNLQNGANGEILSDVTLSAPSANINVSVVDNNGCRGETGKTVSVIASIKDLFAENEIPRTNCPIQILLNDYLNEPISENGQWVYDSDTLSADSIRLSEKNAGDVIELSYNIQIAQCPVHETQNITVEECNLDCPIVTIIQKDNSNLAPNTPMLICSINDEQAQTYTWSAEISTNTGIQELTQNWLGTSNMQFYIRDAVAEQQLRDSLGLADDHPITYKVVVEVASCPPTSSFIDVGKAEIPNPNTPLQIGMAPNPNNGNFVLYLSGKIQNIHIYIYNTIGKQVAYIKPEPSAFNNEQEIPLNLEYLPSGIYYLSAISNQKPSNTVKIAITH